MRIIIIIFIIPVIDWINCAAAASMILILYAFAQIADHWFPFTSGALLAMLLRVCTIAAMITSIPAPNDGTTNTTAVAVAASLNFIWNLL